jgi:hypothetical protein
MSSGHHQNIIRTSSEHHQDIIRRGRRTEDFLGHQNLIRTSSEHHQNLNRTPSNLPPNRNRSGAKFGKPCFEGWRLCAIHGQRGSQQVGRNTPPCPGAVAEGWLAGPVGVRRGKGVISGQSGGEGSRGWGLAYWVSRKGGHGVLRVAREEGEGSRG